MATFPDDVQPHLAPGWPRAAPGNCGQFWTFLGIALRRRGKCLQDSALSWPQINYKVDFQCKNFTRDGSLSLQAEGTKMLYFLCAMIAVAAFKEKFSIMAWNLWQSVESGRLL